MSLAVVGSIAFDSVKTPFGEVERELGGAATHAALTAAHFTDVRVTAVVGEDFGPEHHEVFHEKGIDTSDIERVPDAETLAWTVRYDFDLNLPIPEELHLNVFEGWRPSLSPEAQQCDMLFLGVMDPEAQLEVRGHWTGGKWAVLDTLAYWIEEKREALIEAIKAVDVVLLNDQEARRLTEKPMLMQAAREIRSWGPVAVVIKHGEYGCSLLTEDGYFALPGYPLEAATDPTGTGDSFAGGFLGYLDLIPGDALTERVMRSAVTYGSVMASFCVEEFGARRVRRLTENEVNHRVDEFKRMTHFEHVPTKERPRPGSAGSEEGHRIERPGSTPSTRGYDSPARTAGTQSHESFGRTPSTERLHAPRNPLKE